MTAETWKEECPPEVAPRVFSVLKEGSRESFDTVIAVAFKSNAPGVGIFAAHDRGNGPEPVIEGVALDVLRQVVERWDVTK